MASRLTVTQRRGLLSAHILLSVAWFGVALCFLALSIVAAGTRDDNLLRAVYTSIDTLDKPLVIPLAVGTVVTGILLSTLTQWGLFRYQWIVVKEVLAALSIGLGAAVMSRLPAAIISTISEGGQASSNAGLLLFCIMFQIVSLAASAVLSVYKPGRQRGLRTGREARNLTSASKSATASAQAAPEVSVK